MAPTRARARSAHSWRAVTTRLAAVALAGALVAVASPSEGTPVTTPTLQQASWGGVGNKSGTPIQNVTRVETDTFAWGSTVVSAFQVGRSTKGYGAAAIGWATSTNDGRTWSHGLLPGLTLSSPTPNPNYPLVVNQSVAYDARHQTWLIPSVTYVASGTAFHEKALMVNTSLNGKTWNVATTAVSTNVDKAWGVCDNTATSPYYGSCYVAYSQLDSQLAMAVVTSTDGGLTWSSPVQVPDGLGGNARGYNVVPVVRPDGTVVVVATDVNNGRNNSQLLAFTSADGGATWSVPTPFATVQLHTVVKGLRAFNKPTVDVDVTGRVSVLWADCRFETGCAANDLVLASSNDGITWSLPAQLPLQPGSGATDQFDPGLAVAPGTSGATAQLSVVYYTLVPCATTCIDARYATSYDGGATWSAPYTVNSAPIPTTWLANSPFGRMVGDYNSVSFVHGSAVTVLPLATAAPTPYSETEWALSLPPGWTPGP